MLLAAGLQACTSTSYTGASAAPTQQVQVFHSEAEVARPYSVLGAISTRAPLFMDEASIEMELVNQAKRRGADAIVVDSVTVESIGFRPADPTPGGTAPSAQVPVQEKVAAARLLRYTG